MAKDFWQKPGKYFTGAKNALTPKREKKGAFLKAVLEGFGNGLLFCGIVLTGLGFYAPVSLIPALLTAGVFMAAGAGIRYGAAKIKVAADAPEVSASIAPAPVENAAKVQIPSPAPGFNQTVMEKGIKEIPAPQIASSISPKTSP